MPPVDDDTEKVDDKGNDADTKETQLIENVNNANDLLDDNEKKNEQQNNEEKENKVKIEEDPILNDIEENGENCITRDADKGRNEENTQINSTENTNQMENEPQTNTNEGHNEENSIEPKEAEEKVNTDDTQNEANIQPTVDGNIHENDDNNRNTVYDDPPPSNKSDNHESPYKEPSIIQNEPEVVYVCS